MTERSELVDITVMIFAKKNRVYGGTVEGENNDHKSIKVPMVCMQVAGRKYRESDVDGSAVAMATGEDVESPTIAFLDAGDLVTFANDLLNAGFEAFGDDMKTQMALTILIQKAKRIVDRDIRTMNKDTPEAEPSTDLPSGLYI